MPLSYKRITLDVDAEIRSIVDAERGSGFYDWWNRLIGLVGQYLTDHDYESAVALSGHLHERLRLRTRAQRCLTIITVNERRSPRAVLIEAIHTAIFDWNGVVPSSVRSGNYPVHDPPLGDIANWFRRSVEVAVERELHERAHLLSAQPLDGAEWETREADRMAQSPAPKSAQPSTPALPVRLKGRQRRIAELLIEDPDRTDAELARVTGMSTGSVRKAKSEIARKLERI